MKTLFDKYCKEDIDEIIDGIILMIDDKFKDKDILAKLDSELGEEFLSIARARIQSEVDTGKFIGDVQYFNMEDLRFSTPEIIANFRASRLKCRKIVDLCSGIGVQSLAFSKTCKEVFSFEIDERKVRYSKESFSEIDNLRVFSGDVLSEEIIEQIRKIKPDIIFCDPERLVSEKERNIDSIKPNIKRLIEIYSKITPNLCIEIPPQTELSKLNELGNFEAEYLSLNNKLNRLDLYFGELKSAEISVVDVILGVRLEKDVSVKSKATKKILKYLYEVNPAVLKAGLMNEFANKTSSYILERTEKNKLLMTSGKLYDEKLNSLCNRYGFITVVRRMEDAAFILNEKGFGKVVLKYSVDPKEYWRERDKIENRLHGKKEATLFVVDRKYVVCEKI